MRRQREPVPRDSVPPTLSISTMPPAASLPRAAIALPLLLAGTGLVGGLIPSAAAADEPDAALAARQAEAKRAFADHVVPFVKEYCVECHGNRRSKAALNFEVAVRKPGDPAFGQKWDQAVANVGAQDMPPDDVDALPTDEERQRFLDALAKLKYLSPRDPGLFVIRRLTKTEYGNTLRDLLGVDPSVADGLPDEVAGAGYLNTLSPLQSEQYLGIANAVLDQALAPEGRPPTPVQQRLLGASPAPGADPREAARTVARSLARRAFRRPPSEEEVAVLVRVYDLARQNRLGHPAALRLMLKAVLVSPQFLYITPAAEPPSGQTVAPLDDHQLASRLSYFLWATMPDEELFALADAGKLRERTVLQAQVARLLADERSRALFDGFGTQWLGLGGLPEKSFDTARFPEMTAELRAAMVEEARLFFDSLVRENQSVTRFVDADHTFLNGTLAPLYGLEKSVTGPAMRRVALSDRNRGGILGMPGVLAVTSFPNRTSPVRRGVWVLEQILGEHVPPAPPNVPALEKQDQKQVANLTLRQRTELHRTEAVCANCHRVLDPIGFGLENFDAIGRWRDRDDTGGAIDAAGELPGGKRFATPAELKALIAARRDGLARNFTERLLAYALGRPIEGYDEIVVDQLMETLAEDGYRLQSVIREVATSYPFTHRRVQPPSQAASP